ncbi:OB-fold nucleic acid binding domain-containing protein [Ignicoccus hospitalis]|uniref:Nucleic acid binding, OB-fold, tRNA/helicase-type n=1 Tax=Ignicoccus hospitalis (strain KIN4/I / DSM 18386 / JCM 14125) TaxID=453591 RepID=A8AB31_IGNH4|nr:OB-fold nucleic acid binding domain-containing protein [Ignicoccus hospitalis]ABU82133.1 nucleic acid binding, OB-fold, tRNA/helicase-type [Ignicoccus hospitalis KIN4/I]HIH91091.1 single-stranded DNA-binding protein [Desulfurococcaceae archaeon]
MDKIKDLKEGKSVTIRGRVLEVSEKRVVNTKYGPAELSEAVVGDETGRVRVTLWRDKAGSLEVGDVVEIRDGWTTSYKGEVQVNVNRRTEIVKLDDSEAPSPEEIPEERPKSTARAGPSRSSFSRRRGSNRPSP